MRVLFDIVHPADVLFFLRPMKALLAGGHEIRVCSRRKDIACELLDGFGIEHAPVSSAAQGKAGAALELVLRDAAIIAAARSFQPDVMVGFGGVAISHAGALLGIPSIAFYDSENAALQTRLAYPAVTKLYVPESYGGETPKRKTVRVPGVKELSYLHPDAFSPDRQIAIASSLDPDRQNVFIRLVAWRANHDWGKAGWSLVELQAVIDRFQGRAKIHISSEVALPEAMQAHRFTGKLTDAHHLLGHCDLYVGESATMAAEAAVLGVRSVFAGRDHLGYIEELHTEGLVASGPLSPGASLMDLVDVQMARDDAGVRRSWQTYLAAKPDWSAVVLEALAAYAPRQGKVPGASFRRAS
ncbi:MAG: hypothetical protein AAF753_06985 [Pseudomonadota bacterium]